MAHKLRWSVIMVLRSQVVGVHVCTARPLLTCFPPTTVQLAATGGHGKASMATTLDAELTDSDEPPHDQDFFDATPNSSLVDITSGSENASLGSEDDMVGGERSTEHGRELFGLDGDVDGDSEEEDVEKQLLPVDIGSEDEDDYGILTITNNTNDNEVELGSFSDSDASSMVIDGRAQEVHIRSPEGSEASSDQEELEDFDLDGNAEGSSGEDADKKTCGSYSRTTNTLKEKKYVRNDFLVCSEKSLPRMSTHSTLFRMIPLNNCPVILRYVTTRRRPASLDHLAPFSHRTVQPQRRT
jgi:hypothetical protein